MTSATVAGVATYTANELNQYAQRTVPGVKELAGTALAEATVTVNDLRRQLRLRRIRPV